MRVLVVGGAGYIGSHMVSLLGSQGCDVVTLDNLSTGYKDSVMYGEFIQGSCGDRSLIDSILRSGVDAVMHFASFSQVGSSVTEPSAYYQNNLVNTLTLLDAMRDNGIDKFIFSSSAATYGEPQCCPIDESHRQHPINPYGRTKLMVEQALADYNVAYGIRYVCLRYFNAAGADEHGRLGERHMPETHLIPLILQAALGLREYVEVFGRDYDTPDGTCIRDYVHVQDLCDAHQLALDALMRGEASQMYNLGSGRGFSVQEVIKTAERVTNCKVEIRDSGRRIGDPARLVADPSLIKKRLGWNPRFLRLETMIEHAWGYITLNNVNKTLSHLST
jgi:UDP-glucose 4-epimerase